SLATRAFLAAATGHARRPVPGPQCRTGGESILWPGSPLGPGGRSGLPPAPPAKLTSPTTTRMAWRRASERRRRVLGVGRCVRRGRRAHRGGLAGERGHHPVGGRRAGFSQLERVAVRLDKGGVQI